MVHDGDGGFGEIAALRALLHVDGDGDLWVVGGGVADKSAVGTSRGTVLRRAGLGADGHAVVLEQGGGSRRAADGQLHTLLDTLFRLLGEAVFGDQLRLIFLNQGLVVGGDDTPEEGCPVTGPAVGERAGVYGQLKGRKTVFRLANGGGNGVGVVPA